MATGFFAATRLGQAVLLGCCALSSQAAQARPVLLQAVDMSEMNLSAEGGEAKLILLNAARGSLCRIEVVHFGEMGKTTYSFSFGSRLDAALMQEIRYTVPIAVSPDAKVASRRSVTLASPEGARSLPQEFRTYRAMFQPRHLARCTVRGR